MEVRGLLVRHGAPRLLSIVAAVVGVGAGLGVVAQTSAAWQTDAAYAAAVSSGAWSTGIGTCTVFNSGGNPVPGHACALAGLSYAATGGSAGSRTGTMQLTVQLNKTGGWRILLAPNLAVAAGLPADWSWANAGVIGSDTVTADATYQCATLAEPGAPLSANTPVTNSTAVTLQFSITENRSGASGLICA